MLTDTRRILIETARGDRKAQLVLKNALVANVFSMRFERGDIAISDGYIAGIGSYDGEREVDLHGAFALPGLIDAHIHIESSMLTPARFESVVLPRGTTCVIADPHEIANVAGTQGLSYMLASAHALSMDMFFDLPSCVPAHRLERSAAKLGADALKPFYEDGLVIGLGEMMNPQGVVAGDADCLDKINDALAAYRRVNGHAPMLSGKALNAYAVAGVTSDHECVSMDEAEEKLARGQYVMIREGSAAHNLRALLPLLTKPSARVMLVSDDRHPEDLLYEGHMDKLIGLAMDMGAEPLCAIAAASFNTAQYYGMTDRGAIAPGYRADIAVFDELRAGGVREVYKDGALVAAKGRLLCEGASIDTPQSVARSVNIPPVTADMLKASFDGGVLRAIELVKSELLTHEYDTQAPTEGDGVDVSRDIIKLAIFERHHASGEHAVAFLKGYGLRSGAVAMSIAHDAHNIIAAGTNDADIALAVNTVREMQGGIAVTLGSEVLCSLRLSVGGLMSDAPAPDTAEALRAVSAKLRELGVDADVDPIVTLSFTALPVIPEIRLTLSGLARV